MVLKIISQNDKAEKIVSVEANDTGGFTVHDSAVLFQGDFQRQGSDLYIRLEGHDTVRLPDYFLSHPPQEILDSNGARLHGETVELLAGPIAPGLFAQLGDSFGQSASAAIGQVETVAGDTSVQRTDGTVEVLEVGTKIFQQDVVQTGEGGQVSVTFVDGTIFTLAASSRMVIDELIYDADGSDNSGSFSLLQGGFVFIAGQVAKTGSMEVGTPSSTMGIRGTTVVVEVGASNGEVTSEITLTRDPDGDIGEVVVFDLDGNLIATIADTDTKWVFELGGQGYEVSRTFQDDADDSLLIAEAYAAYRSAFGRVEAGDTFVTLGDTGGRSIGSPSTGSGGTNLEVDSIDEPGGIDGIEDIQIEEMDDLQFDEGLNTLEEELVVPVVVVTGFEDASEDSAISGNVEIIGDVAGQLNFVVSSAPGNGTVSVNADGSFVFVPNPNFNGQDTFTVTGTDQAGVSVDGVVIVNVLPVNDAPVVADQSISVSEDQTIVGVIAASDIENDALTFSIASSPANGEVALQQNGAYSYRADPNFTGSDSFEVIVTDTSGDSSQASITVFVNAVNDAPVAQDATASVSEDGTVTGTIVAEDVDGDTLTYTLATPSASGTVVLLGGGAYSYTPDADFEGSDSFEVLIADGQGGSTTATVSVTVGAVNDAPVAQDATASVSEDGTVTGTIVAEDVDGDTLTYTLATPSASGTVVLLGGGAYSYTPDADFEGSDSFEVLIADGQGGSTTATVSVTVGAVNDAPVAQDATASVSEDGTVTGTIVAEDVDGDTLTYTLATPSASGTVVLLGGGAYSYTPDADFEGSDSFEVLIADGQGGSTTATVSVTVGAVNDAPVAQDATASVSEDGTVTGTIVAEDVDGDTLTYTLATPSASGTVVLLGGGAYSYTPDADFEGSDSFEVLIADGQGGSTTATVSVTVGAVNDAPVAQDATASVSEDGTVTGTIVAEDVDGDTLTYTLATPSASGTVVLLGGGAYSYTPDADFEGSDSFEVLIADGQGGSTTATVSVTVGAVNDAPVAQDATASVSEDGTVTGTIVAEDVDGDTLTYTLATPSASGTVVLLGGGAYSYTPDADFEGSDSFEVLIADGQGGSTTATVSVTVGAVNDAPVAQDATASVSEDGTVTGTIVAEDVDGDTLTYTLATPSASGTVVLLGGGAYSYTPDADFEGSDSFEVLIADGQGGSTTATVSVTVGAVNDAPVAQDATASVSEDGTVTGTIVAEDVDGDTLTYTLATPSASGTVVLLGGGAYSYTPDADFEGSDSFEVLIADGQGGSTTATVSVTVGAVNDAPVAQDATASVSEDGTVTGTIVAEDVDGDTLTYTLATPSASGTVVLLGGGAYSYTPDADFEGSDSFEVLIADGQGGSTTATVSVTVGAVNDAPVAQDATASVSEDGTVTGTIVAEDVDGDTLTYTLATPSASGTVVLLGGGAYSYTPDADFEGSDSFEVLIADGQGGSTTATVSVTVGAVNDAPVAQDATASVSEDGTVTGTIVAEDVDGDTLTYTLATPSASGTVVLLGGGAYSYTPDADFEGSDSFEVLIADGQGGSTTATVSVTVGAVNDAPVAQDATASVSEDGTVTGTIVAEDVDGDTLTYTLATPSASGTVVLLGGGAYSYTPDADFEGSDSFEVLIADGQGGSTTATVSVTVGAVNDAPVAQDATASVSEDGTVTGTIVAEDVDGDTLTYTLATPSASGTVVLLGGGAYSYTPDADFEGSDSFEVLIADGQGGSTTATVSVTVGAVNDAPVAQDATASVSEDGTVTGTIVAEDVDGDTLTYTLATPSASGTVVLLGGGAYSYTPDADFEGSDSFEVLIADGQGGSTTATVSVTVGAVNDAPVAQDATASVSEDGTVTGTIVAEDVDGDTLTYTLATPSASGTVVLLGGGAYSYTPDADFEGSDSFEVLIADGQGGSTTATVSVTVGAVNDAPIINVDASAGFSEAADANSQFLIDNGSIYFTDPDANNLIDVTYSANGDPIWSDGQLSPEIRALLLSGLSLSAIGQAVPGEATWNYYASDLDLDFLGQSETISWSYTVSATDEAGSKATQTLSFSITGENDAPVPKDENVDVEKGGSFSGALSASDLDTNDVLAFAVVGAGPAHGDLSLNSNGSFTYTPDVGYLGLDVFEYSVTDSSGEVRTANVVIAVQFGDDATAEQSVKLNILPDGTVSAATSEIISGAVNLVITIDATGSLDPIEFQQQLDAVASALDTLASQYNGAANIFNVSLVVYADGIGGDGVDAITVTGADGETSFDLVNPAYDGGTEQPALNKALSDAIEKISDAVDEPQIFVGQNETLPVKDKTGDYSEALVLAEKIFDDRNKDADFDLSNETNIIYFITNGVQTGGNQWTEDVDRITDVSIKKFEVDIQAFGIGRSVNNGTLNQLDPDAILLNGPEELEAAFNITPLFSAQLVDLSVTLIVDGVEKGEIADESSISQNGLSSVLSLAELEGFAGILGEENRVSALAGFDLDGDTNTIELQLFTSKVFSKADDTQTITGKNSSELLLGSDFNDDIAGGLGNDILFGYEGNDTLNGGGGKDVIRAGSGDDEIVVTTTSVLGDAVDGGAGRDALKIDALGEISNLIAEGAIDGIEVIDMNNGVADILALSFDEIVDLSETSDSELETLLGKALENAHTINGDKNDTLVLDRQGEYTITQEAGPPGSELAIYTFSIGAGPALATLGVDAGDDGVNVVVA